MSTLKNRNKNPWYKEKDVRAISIIWLVLTIILCLNGFYFIPSLMGISASDTMEDVIRTMTYFTVAAAPVASLVFAIAIYSVFGWRHKGSSMPVKDGPPIRTNNVVTSIWVVVSSILCLGTLVWGLTLMSGIHAENSPAEESMVVNVYGQQWAWSYSYPENKNVESHELYLPVDKQIVFKVTSYDVVHSFWIPEMGTKVDANPGAVTQTKTKPNKVGVYTVRCAELCGLYHSQMQNRVHVVSQADFDAWVAKQNQFAYEQPAEEE